MPLNPYAKVFVPGAVTKQQSLLSPHVKHSQQHSTSQQDTGVQPNGLAQPAQPLPAAVKIESREITDEEVQFNEVLFSSEESPRSHLSASPSGVFEDAEASSVTSSPAQQQALPPFQVPSFHGSPAAEQPGQPSSNANQKVGPADFELLRVVGQGAFGKVFQVRKKDTGVIYAMKVMKKQRIVERAHGEYVKAERDVLTAVFHPYIVTLRYSFQTSSKLYLVLDFISGGHLFFQLYRQGIFDEPLARLYTAELVLAIAHLHSLGFVHRDLKPENVLLDSEGHIKVTDFGLAKGEMGDDDQRTNSFIGTMEYMAPEIIAGNGHGKAVDWWSIGILLYEMLCGTPPFNAKSRNQLQKQILSQKLKLPGYLSTSAQSLLKGLLIRDPKKRLGGGPDGSKAVLEHPFFRPINWDRLKRHEIPSPFKPTIREVSSVENFDKMWTDQAPLDSPCGTPQRTSPEDMFHGYSYVAPSLISELFQQHANVS
jgi:p70 ribosomal S6 kinase